MKIIEGKEIASVYVAKADLDLPKELLARIRGRGLGVWAKAELEVVDSAGKILDRRAGPSRSFLRNFGRFIRGYLSVVTTVNEDITDQTGVAQKPRLITGALSANGGGLSRVINPSAGFIRFGSGTAAVLSTDFNVQTPIATLADAVVTTTILVEDNVQSQWQYQGSSPNTGGSVTVNEVAIFGNLNSATANTFFAAAQLRDLISPGVVVGVGLTALGRYTITVAV